jgi:DNA-binding transcriptional ArsR family regulator
MKREVSALALADEQVEEVAALLRALGEPSRLRILRALWERPATVGAIVDATGMKQANVSKQLALLHSAGIVARTRQGTSIIYRIALPIVRDLCALVCRGADEIALRKAS